MCFDGGRKGLGGRRDYEGHRFFLIFLAFLKILAFFKAFFLAFLAFFGFFWLFYFLKNVYLVGLHRPISPLQSLQRVAANCCCVRIAPSQGSHVVLFKIAAPRCASMAKSEDLCDAYQKGLY
jgi:hypothetical protein